MRWQEIIITSDADLAEALSDFLIDLTGRGICLEDRPASSIQTAPATQCIGNVQKCLHGLKID